MAKTNPLAMVSEATVDPRQRMKEVRQDLKMYIGGSNPWGIAHLGELYTNAEDQKRLIIALQDFLEDRTTRHNKASAHVADLIDRVDGEMAVADQQIARIMNLKAVAQHNYNSWFGANQQLEAQIKVNADLKEQLDTKEAKLQTVLDTLAIVMAG